MKVLLTPAGIKAICERPSKLRTYATADEYEMERYMNVAREAAVTALQASGCPDIGPCPSPDEAPITCPECWGSWIDQQEFEQHADA